ncbi:MAG: hypothetical protein CVU22_02670 [Betaproteobacteria bacterium HGW-Betaproteobacteria-16]|nr:MAG: hypothetical protein CVU22_02670 [Betaproteobacteria bacterium HGW-Betaproteobacteria-16]
MPMNTENPDHEERRLMGEGATGTTAAQGRPKQGQPPRGAATRASGGAWGQLLLLAGRSPLRRRALPDHSLTAHSGLSNCGFQANL